MGVLDLIHSNCEKSFSKIKRIKINKKAIEIKIPIKWFNFNDLLTGCKAFKSSLLESIKANNISIKTPPA